LKTTKLPPSPIPQTRLGRFARIGMAAGALAASAAAQGLKRHGTRRASRTFAARCCPPPTPSGSRSSSARLRGAAMKIGQLVSMQGEDILPAEFAQALAVLRSQAAPMPPQQLRRVLGREYGSGWERRFAAFDHEPVAAASIGQVHRATTTDGRELALKIQYPGVARSIASDVDNVAALLRMFNLLPIVLDVAASPTKPSANSSRRPTTSARHAFSSTSPPWSPTSRRCSCRACTAT
jgi:aarF domain-containing kinase